MTLNIKKIFFLHALISLEYFQRDVTYFFVLGEMFRMSPGISSLKPRTASVTVPLSFSEYGNLDMSCAA